MFDNLTLIIIITVIIANMGFASTNLNTLLYAFALCDLIFLWYFLSSVLDVLNVSLCTFNCPCS